MCASQKSSYKIRLNYEASLSQAKALVKTAERLERCAGLEFAENIRKVQKYWAGNNALEYIRKAKTVRERIVEDAGRLRYEAERIRRIAEEIYRAEMKSLEKMK